MRSLRASCYPNLIAVLVDNGSDYSNESEYRAILPGLVYRRLVRNRGFAAGSNAGIAVARESEADYVLLLNNDAEVAPDAIGRLVNCAEEHPRFGALTATVYHRENRGRLWHAGARTLVLWPFARRITMAELKGPEPVPVDFATGCALLLRGAAIDTVGELDERFFMYSEDIDLCLRMREAGFRIGAVPSALAWHRVAASAYGDSPARAWQRSRSRFAILPEARPGAILAGGGSFYIRLSGARHSCRRVAGPLGCGQGNRRRILRKRRSGRPV